VVFVWNFDQMDESTKDSSGRKRRQSLDSQLKTSPVMDIIGIRSHSNVFQPISLGSFDKKSITNSRNILQKRATFGSLLSLEAGNEYLNQMKEDFEANLGNAKSTADRRLFWQFLVCVFKFFLSSNSLIVYSTVLPLQPPVGKGLEGNWILCLLYFPVVQAFFTVCGAYEAARMLIGTIDISQTSMLFVSILLGSFGALVTYGIFGFWPLNVFWFALTSEFGACVLPYLFQKERTLRNPDFFKLYLYQVKTMLFACSPLIACIAYVVGMTKITTSWHKIALSFAFLVIMEVLKYLNSRYVRGDIEDPFYVHEIINCFFVESITQYVSFNTLLDKVLYLRLSKSRHWSFPLHSGR
jgi:hypothetical protein